MTHPSIGGGPVPLSGEVLAGWGLIGSRFTDPLGRECEVVEGMAGLRPAYVAVRNEDGEISHETLHHVLSRVVERVPEFSVLLSILNRLQALDDLVSRFVQDSVALGDDATQRDVISDINHILGETNREAMETMAHYRNRASRRLAF